MLKTSISLVAAGMAIAFGGSAFAAETITAPFTMPSNATSQMYSGDVQVTVSGVGNAAGSRDNDAFYFVGGEAHTDGYYQLGFSTSPLGTYDNADAVANQLSGRPAYSLTNTYTFDLNVGSNPTLLYFGVTDQDFSDNGGAFTITVSEAGESGGVPEPATWAMMLLGFGMVGAGLRYRRKSTAVRFA